jgi:hypothetical protein
MKNKGGYLFMKVKKASKIKMVVVVTLLAMVLQCMPVMAAGLKTISVKGTPRISANKKQLNFQLDVTYLNKNVGGYWVYNNNNSRRITTVYRQTLYGATVMRSLRTISCPYKKGVRASYKIVPFNKKGKPFGSPVVVSYRMR